MKNSIEKEHPKMLTRGEVAEFFRVSTATIKRWEINGTLIPVRIGDHLVRFLQQDIDNLVISSKKCLPDIAAMTDKQKVECLLDQWPDAEVISGSGHSPTADYYRLHFQFDKQGKLKENLK